MHPARLLTTFLGVSLAFAHTRRRHGEDADDTDDTDSGSDSDNDPSSSATNTTNASSGSSGDAGQGDSHCVNLLCASAIVNANNTVTYVLQSRDQSSLGWMALGFGTSMINSPMVIVWPNSDGSVTISQRQASDHIMPSPVANPPRLATLQNSLTAASTTSNPKIAFSLPANSDVQQDVIWAFGTDHPSKDAASTINMHIDSGTFSLNLAAQAASFHPAVQGDNSSSSGSPASQPGSLKLPYQYYQRLIIAHAVFCSLGFVILLPAGAYVARYLRVISPNWFQGHATIQFWISGPIIICGFALAIGAVANAKVKHFDDKHKVLGLILFLAYCVQCSLGAFIHWIKNPNKVHRPPQNYVHAVFGLVIIAVSLYQVHLGYNKEWPTTTGRDDVPDGVNKIFIAWAVVVPVGYFMGLLLLQKQFRQENAARDRKLGQSPPSAIPLTPTEFRYHPI